MYEGTIGRAADAMYRMRKEKEMELQGMRGGLDAETMRRKYEHDTRMAEMRKRSRR